MRIGLRLSARNTPTCVGKTLWGIFGLYLYKKHPHVRGEDRLSDDETPPTAETPPRAWGRRALLKKANDIFGNTPTCVGKTIQRKNVKNERRKHPHVRGEDYNAALRKAQRERNTPTCVGKTPA